MATITSFTVEDLRWPTSLDASGSDAMNKVGDYSAGYVVLKTDNPNLYGCGFTFTIGQGNDVVCLAIQHVAKRVVGKTMVELTKNMGKTWRYLCSGNARWIGPEIGALHLATASVVNALWDLWAKIEGKPVWQLVADMTPEELVRCIDFRYITDALTPAEAIQILRAAEKGKSERRRHVLDSQAVPAYTTSAGWLGYSDEKMKKLIRDNVITGFKHFKFKVGADLEDDKRRLAIAREILGYDKGYFVMVDANQVWDVREAISWMMELSQYRPWFIEEPTAPNDILGHATIRKALKSVNIAVATGEQCQNRVIFKQLLQAEAIDICQIDACRMGGVNEVLAVLLLAKKFGVPVIPHSGGIGLCSYTTHLSTIDYLCISGKPSLLEHIDAFHDQLIEPLKVKDGFFVTPEIPGYSVEYKAEAIATYRFPSGTFWTSDKAKPILANNWPELEEC